MAKDIILIQKLYRGKKQIIICFLFTSLFILLSIQNSFSVSDTNSGQDLGNTANTNNIADSDFDYFSFIERIINETPGSFTAQELSIIQSDTYFMNKIREIYQNGENFSSLEKTILLYKTTQCNDGIDNEGDGLIDKEDPGCWTDITNSNTYSLFLNNEGRSSSSCFADSDCGSNKFVGDRYCLSGDVYRNYATFTCANKGKGNAKCAKKTYPELISSCVYGCGKGFCETHTEETVTNTIDTIEQQTIELNPLQVEKKFPDKNFQVLDSKNFAYLIIQLVIGICLESLLIFLIKKK
ncbi:Uncharacterised protein [uncultured archaeon]|nr:Uncharacterised protein [uncultured archaeon]